MKYNHLPYNKNLQAKGSFRYIIDFYCASAKLAIEIDGSQHYEDDGMVQDKQRTEQLNLLGIKVIRFSNRDVDTNFEGVCTAIHLEIQKLLQEDE